MIFFKLNYTLKNDLSNSLNFIRISLASMKKSSLKSIHWNITQELHINNKSEFLSWYSVILDIIESKLYKVPKDKKNRDPPSNVCKVFFDNKGVEMINLPRILNDQSLLDFLPSLPNKFEIPMVCYKLHEPIANKKFNFNNFVSSLDVNLFLNDHTSLPCNCEHSLFKDNHHNHIVTGNLNIVENSKLLKLLSKGPKYREPVNIDFQQAKKGHRGWYRVM